MRKILNQTQKLKVIWLGIRDALAGTEQDYTEMRLSRAVFLLAIPMIIEMSMEAVFALVDMYFVSGLGADAVAAVGITESMMTIIYALALGISTSVTAIVARRIGEKNPLAASHAAIQAIYCGIAVSIAIAIPASIYAKEVLSLMGASEDIIQRGSGYTQWMFAGNGVIMLLFIHNAVFRGAGDAAIAMRVLLVSNGINIVLDPLLIYGYGPFPEYGVTGAAIATNIGRGTGVLFQIIVLLRGTSRLKIRLARFLPDVGVILKIIRLSVWAVLQNIIATSSWVFLVMLVTGFGDVVIAGYTISIRIIIFVLLPSWGLSNAASTLVGQNLGANRPDRASRSAWVIAMVNFFFLGGMGCVLSIFPNVFVSFFHISPDVANEAVQSLRIISFGFSLYGVGMVMTQSFNGAGDTITPTWINFFCFWLFEIPLAWFLSTKTGLQQTGVYYSIFIAESLIAILGVIIFTRGKWKNRKV